MLQARALLPADPRQQAGRRAKHGRENVVERVVQSSEAGLSSQRSSPSIFGAAVEVPHPLSLPPTARRT